MTRSSRNPGSSSSGSSRLHVSATAAGATLNSAPAGRGLQPEPKAAAEPSRIRTRTAASSASSASSASTASSASSSASAPSPVLLQAPTRRTRLQQQQQQPATAPAAENDPATRPATPAQPAAAASASAALSDHRHAPNQAVLVCSPPASTASALPAASPSLASMAPSSRGPAPRAYVSDPARSAPQPPAVGSMPDLHTHGSLAGATGTGHRSGTADRAADTCADEGDLAEFVEFSPQTPSMLSGQPQRTNRNTYNMPHTETLAPTLPLDATLPLDLGLDPESLMLLGGAAVAQPGADSRFDQRVNHHDNSAAAFVHLGHGPLQQPPSIHQRTAAAGGFADGINATAMLSWDQMPTLPLDSYSLDSMMLQAEEEAHMAILHGLNSSAMAAEPANNTSRSSNNNSSNGEPRSVAGSRPATTNAPLSNSFQMAAPSAAPVASAQPPSDPIRAPISATADAPASQDPTSLPGTQLLQPSQQATQLTHAIQQHMDRALFTPPQAKHANNGSDSHNSTPTSSSTPFKRPLMSAEQIREIRRRRGLGGEDGRPSPGDDHLGYSQQSMYLSAGLRVAPSPEVPDTQPLCSLNSNLPHLDEDDEDIARLREAMHPSHSSRSLPLGLEDSIILDDPSLSATRLNPVGIATSTATATETATATPTTASDHATTDEVVSSSSRETSSDRGPATDALLGNPEHADDDRDTLAVGDMVSQPLVSDRSVFDHPYARRSQDQDAQFAAQSDLCEENREESCDGSQSHARPSVHLVVPAAECTSLSQMTTQEPVPRESQEALATALGDADQEEARLDDCADASTAKTPSKPMVPTAAAASSASGPLSAPPGTARKARYAPQPSPPSASGPALSAPSAVASVAASSVPAAAMGVTPVRQSGRLRGRSTAQSAVSLAPSTARRGAKGRLPAAAGAVSASAALGLASDARDESLEPSVNGSESATPSQTGKDDMPKPSTRRSARRGVPTAASASAAAATAKTPVRPSRRLPGVSPALAFDDLTSSLGNGNDTQMEVKTGDRECSGCSTRLTTCWHEGADGTKSLCSKCRRDYVLEQRSRGTSVNSSDAHDSHGSRSQQARQDQHAAQILALDSQTQEAHEAEHESQPVRRSGRRAVHVSMARIDGSSSESDNSADENYSLRSGNAEVSAPTTRSKRKETSKARQSVSKHRRLSGPEQEPAADAQNAEQDVKMETESVQSDAAGSRPATRRGGRRAAGKPPGGGAADSTRPSTPFAVPAASSALATPTATRASSAPATAGFENGCHVWALWVSDGLYYPATVNARLGKTSKYMIVYVKDNTTDLLDTSLLVPFDLAVGDMCFATSKNGDVRQPVCIESVVHLFKTYRIVAEGKTEPRTAALSMLVTSDAMLAASKECRAKAALAGGASDARPASRGLFRGFGFLLSFSGTPSVESAEDSNQIQDSPWTSNKDFVVKQIEQSGGVVYEDLASVYSGREPRNVQGPAVIVLIAVRPARTKKFLMSLALGIPVIASSWLRACLAQNELLDYHAFRLSNGHSLEMGHWCAAPALPEGVFQGLQIYVFAKDDASKHDLEEILQSGNAQIVTKKAFRLHGQCQYVVCRTRPTGDDLAFIAGRTQAPIVSQEWVSQCIINQRLLGVGGHAKYTAWPDDALAPTMSASTSVSTTA